MSSYIKEDFKPDEHTLNLLRKKGIFQDFCDHIMPHFMSYWTDLKSQGSAKGKKSSWQSTFLNWAIRAHQGIVGKEYEENKHRRTDHGGLRNDLFEVALSGVGQCPRAKGNAPAQKAMPYRLPDPPTPGPAMSPEDAFAALRKILK